MRDAKQLQAKARGHLVTPHGTFFEVVSGASKRVYAVTPRHGASPVCSCDWSARRPSAVSAVCSHVLAVLEYAARLKGFTVSAWASETDAQRQHRPVQKVGDGVVVTVRRVAA